MEEIKREAELGLPSIGIPAEVLCNPELALIEGYLFGYIRNLSLSKRGCWASNRYLGELAWVGKQTVSNSISNLERYGYIIIKYTYKPYTKEKQRHIYINLDYQELYKEVVEYIHEVRISGEPPLKETLYTLIGKVLIKIGRKRDKKKDKTSITKVIEEPQGGFPTTKIKPRKKTIPIKSKQAPTEPKPKTYHHQDHTIFDGYPEEVKSLFLKWNSLGKPLTQHQEKMNGTFKKAMTDLTKILKRHPHQEIAETFQSYYYLVKNPESVVSKSVPGHVVGLNEFFGFSSMTKQRMQKQRVPLQIKSWFDECLKGEDHLAETYGRFIRDDHPLVTKEFVDLWKESTGRRRLPVDTVNMFRTSARKFAAYHDRNKANIDFDYHEVNAVNVCVKYLFEMVDKRVNENWLEVVPAWFASDKMYTQWLPKFFYDMGMLKDEGEFYEEMDFDREQEDEDDIWERQNDDVFEGKA